MPRLARLVFPGHAHHVAQVAATGRVAFPTNKDCAEYGKLLAEAGRKHGLAFWCWCLLRRRVDLIAIPEERESLARALAEANWRYAIRVNRRTGERGRRFKERFASYPIEPGLSLVMAAYVVEHRPRTAVRELEKAIFWPWSSAAYNAGRVPSDPLVEKDNPFRKMAGIWRRILLHNMGPEPWTETDWRLGNGRPLGEPGWADTMESARWMRGEADSMLRVAHYLMPPAIRECYLKHCRRKRRER